MEQIDMDETIIREISREGWQAVTTIQLGRNKELDIFTRATLDGNLVTTSQVWRLEPDGTRRHAVGLGSVGDFHCEVLSSRPDDVSESAIREQHCAALDMRDNIVAHAAAHYLGLHYNFPSNGG